ncbi:MAG: acyl-CoA dehydrogenase family protein [Nannocystaceae bacterium]
MTSRQQSTTPIGYLLRALGQFSGSPWAEHPVIRRFTHTVLHDGMKTVVHAGKQASTRFREVAKLLPGEMLQRPRPESARPSAFDLSLSEDQEATREMLQRFARDVLTKGAREAETSGDDRTCITNLLTQIHDLGLTAITVPEALGGLAESRQPMSSTLIAEDLAFGDFGLALAGLAPLSVASAISEFGTAEQQGRYLPPLIDEEYVPATIAWAEPRATFTPQVLHTRAHRSGDHFILEGCKTLVPLANEAELLLVFAHLQGEGPRGFLVEATTPGVQAKPQRTMGIQAAAPGTVVLSGARVPQSALLGDNSTWSASAIDNLVARGRIGMSALAVGTCRAVLDYVIEYCNSRTAFGEPISHRQAVAFMIADIAVELDGMRLLTYRAASRAQQGLDYHKQAHLARVQCGEKAMQIASDGLQLLGGHGYVCEHPLERWYRQMRAVATLEGAVIV